MIAGKKFPCPEVCRSPRHRLIATSGMRSPNTLEHRRLSIIWPVLGHWFRVRRNSTRWQVRPLPSSFAAGHRHCAAGVDIGRRLASTVGYVACCPSLMYPSPTSNSVCSFLFSAGKESKNSTASSTVISRTSEIDLPLKRILNVSGLYLLPLQESQVT